MAHHRRQSRSHRRWWRWPGRILCACAVLVVIGVGIWHPNATAKDLSVAQDRRLCAVLEAIVALTYVEVPPPIGASAEQQEVTRQVNDYLAQRREAVLNMESVRELGCG